ncbi:C40 family peptidase [Proteiniphilum sp. X52]|uniref:C40 family peptidase n=1 Tax=Proteiniphilum sp. X52 TaxID=2382159 RepID=UPI001313E7E4|nr:C40 family peptidase [Proteiniphilum sp. X52]
MDSVIQRLKEKHAPDSRVEVFDIVATQRKDTIVLQGETTSMPAYEELILLAGSMPGQMEESIRLLPDKELGDAIWGVIYNSVGTLRAEPRYGSELVSQGLLGMPVKILEKRGGWCRIQTPDKYIGWINGSVRAMTQSERQQYLRQPKVVVTSVFARSQQRADSDFPPVSDLVVGNMLVVKGEKEGFYQVVYPDGREAYVRKSDAKETTDWLKSMDLAGESIVNSAYRFMGVPYLWGGTSSKGLDCSGFTKTVYFMHAIILPRDASQQVHCGKLIDSSGDFSGALPGDLLFFGSKATDDSPKERVVHVGIYMGNKRFIHASDYVHINSLDPADPLYDEFNANRYLRTKRIIGEVGTPGIENIFENEFYKQ